MRKSLYRTLESAMINFNLTHKPEIVPTDISQPEASFAFVFFKQDNAIKGATYHDITGQNLEMGRYISASETLDWITSQCITSNAKLSQSWNPEHVLVDTSRTLIFYQKSFKDRMWFRTSNQHIALNVPYPALLYKVDRVSRSLYVWALDRDSRPTLKSNIYHAPLMNLGMSGNVCQGSAPIPNDLSGDCSKGVVDALIKSNFSHVNHSQTMKLKDKESVSNTDFIDFYRSIEHMVDFPSCHLNSTNQTIADLLG